MPRLRDKKYIFGNAFNEFNSEEKLLIRASMDFLDSTGELPLHQFLWNFDQVGLIRLVRAICHLREIQLETVCEIMRDYLGSTEQQ